MALVVNDFVERRKEFSMLEAQCILAARWISLTGYPGVDENEIAKAMTTLREIDDEMNDTSSLPDNSLPHTPKAPLCLEAQSRIKADTWNHSFIDVLKARQRDRSSSAVACYDRPLFRMQEFIKKQSQKRNAQVTSHYHALFQEGSEDVEMFKPPEGAANRRIKLQKEKEREAKAHIGAKRPKGAGKVVFVSPCKKAPLRVSGEFVPQCYRIAEGKAEESTKRRKEIAARAEEWKKPAYRAPTMEETKKQFSHLQSTYHRIFTDEGDSFFQPPDDAHNPRKAVQRHKEEQESRIVKSQPRSTYSPEKKKVERKPNDFIPRVYAVAQARAEEAAQKKKEQQEQEDAEQARRKKQARLARSSLGQTLSPTRSQPPSPGNSPAKPVIQTTPSGRQTRPRTTERPPVFQFAIEQPVANPDAEEEEDLSPFCWLYGSIQFRSSDTEAGCLQRAVGLIDRMADKANTLGMPCHVVIDIIANRKAITAASPFAVGAGIHEYVMTRHMPEPLTSCFVGVSDNAHTCIGRDAYCTSLDISSQKYLLEGMVDNFHHFIVAPPDLQGEGEGEGEEGEEHQVGEEEVDEIPQETTISTEPSPVRETEVDERYVEEEEVNAAVNDFGYGIGGPQLDEDAAEEAARDEDAGEEGGTPHPPADPELRNQIDASLD
eukprot:TRINITY_DN27660_c0_g1_i1.p1 TRINITY_DN27660_c0_g1~~TRINITY_DN27660_c0_g1_i1.p1  ORF type:complete len:660 (+),score=68.25 TRINITY_DN27660_c0_g1_i1:27-2006(+)